MLVAWFFHPHKAKTLLDQELTGPAPTTWTEEEGKMKNNSRPRIHKSLLQSSGWEEAAEGRAEGARDSV